MAKRTSFFCMYSENVGTSNVAGANVAINVDDNPKSLPPSPRQTTDYINSGGSSTNRPSCLKK